MRALLAAVLAVFLAASPVVASVGIGWRQAPIGLKVYVTANNIGPGITQAIADWNGSPYVELIAVGPSSGTFTMNGRTWPCGVRANAIVICVSDTNNNDFTVLSRKGGYIHSAFVGLYRSSMQAPICHEIGHALGLNHTHADVDPDSCLNGPTQGDHPSAQDFADLAAMYGP